MNGSIGARGFRVIIGAFLALAFVSATGSAASASQTTITVYVDGEGTGSISSSPAALISQCRDTCSADFTVDEEVTFTADPDPGMGFTEWEGFCGSIYADVVGNTCTFAPDEFFDYDGQGPRATFEPSPVGDDFADAVALESMGSPGGVDAYEAFGVTDGGSHEPGEPVHAASGESASAWAKWTAPAFAHVEATTCSNFTDFDTTLAAYTGTAIENLQQVGSNDNGPPYECDHQSFGDPIKAKLFFEATKGVTYYFAVDGANGSVGQYSLDLYATRTPRPVTLSFGGNGKGTVTSSPAGINCDSSAGTCLNNIGDSRQIVLKATPAVNSSFSGFGGACAGTDPCTLTITDATSIKASFALVPHDLQVSTSGRGSGRIQYVGPNTPDCNGKSCVSTYDYGTAITLQPVADKGSKFIGWSGDCTGTGPCMVDMTKDTNVSAQFETPVILKVGKPVVNARKGTALIPITVDQSATIKLTGTGLKTQTKSAGAARTVKVPIKPKGKPLKTLKKKGKAKVKFVVTAKGASGDVTRVARTVQLKKVKKT